MSTTFELFDVVSGNVFDDFDRESDAWDALLEIERTQGPSVVRRFALFRNVDDDSSLIAMEDELVDRVKRQRKEPAATSH